jgi:hypothetical protein
MTGKSRVIEMGNQSATFGQEINDCTLSQDSIFNDELKSVDCAMDRRNFCQLSAHTQLSAYETSQQY